MAGWLPVIAGAGKTAAFALPILHALKVLV
jgi:hypothetical protein